MREEVVPGGELLTDQHARRAGAHEQEEILLARVRDDDRNLAQLVPAHVFTVTAREPAQHAFVRDLQLRAALAYFPREEPWFERENGEHGERDTWHPPARVAGPRGIQRQQGDRE